MQIRHIIITILCCFNIATVTAATQVSKDGITWSFDRDYQTGQFVNGDYYVIDSGSGVNVIGITQPHGGSTDGSMINPSSQSAHGYNQVAPAYNATLNVARSVSSSSPLNVRAGSSLVSTIGRTYDTKQTYVGNAAVLTVLNSQPPAGSFRPPYFGTDKSIKHNRSEMDLSKLRNLANISGMPSLSSTEDSIARPWIDTLGGWQGRQVHPSNNMPDYGREMANVVGIAGLMLNSNFTDAEKEKLAIYMCQLGIDFYGIAVNASVGWMADGGHASGRKFPIVVAGSLLGDNNMRNVGSLTAFGEDQQTFYVSQKEVDITNGSTWNPDTRGGTPQPYSTSDIGTPEWGIRHAYVPAYDNKAWTAMYRNCCTAVAWGGEVLAIEAMGLKDAWNHDALFDYMERYMKNGGSQWSPWVASMWNTYHNNMAPQKAPPMPPSLDL
jgi:hypothetical protein